MRIAHINVMATLSTGRVAVEICETAQELGHRALLAFSRGYPPADVPYLRVGNALDVRLHGALARLTDRSGFFSRLATRKLVRRLERYRPDLVHLHNLHGYYLHVPTLFGYLRRSGVPVVWTLHDCWAFTGHCAYYSMAKCEKWRTGCDDCPNQRMYPCSLFVDQSRRNWAQKRALFTSLADLSLVAPSEWLAGEVSRSFLRKYPLYVIPNGLDLETFRASDDPALLATVIKRYGLETVGDRRLLLSVASTWEPRKGLHDLFLLSRELPENLCLVVVGLKEQEMKLVRDVQWDEMTEAERELPEEERDALPKRVYGMPRTAFTRELVALYTAADVCVSLSHEETQGLTLLEAMACGTQALCYDATALPELVTPETGRVVPEGDIAAAVAACAELCARPCAPEACRARASRYERRRQWTQYVRLYEQIARTRGEGGKA